MSTLNIQSMASIQCRLSLLNTFMSCLFLADRSQTNGGVVMRSKRQLIGVITVFIMLNVFNMINVAAQDSVLATLTPNQTTMLNDINRYRIRENLVHLAPST